MRVFFDHQAFCIQEYGGLSRYYTELIAGLQKASDATPLLPLRWSNNRHLQDAGLQNRPFFPNRQFRGKRNLLYTANRWNDIRAIQTQSFDIFHATYYDPYFLPYLNARKIKTPLVVTFLDMIHEKLAHQFPYLAQDKAIVQHKRLLAKRADRLIAVSENTKRDLVDFLNVDPDKIDVIYHGSSFAPVVPESDTPAIQQREPYLLFVGLRKGYKNFDGMLREIAPLMIREKIRLLSVGGGAFSPAENVFIDTLGVADLVRQVSATDNQLTELYRQALAFIFPSLYEGFGIPILEAFACGCPCILSNQSSLPEIGGNAALYFDPLQADSLTTQVQLLIDDSDLGHQLASDGRERVRHFTWDTATRQTIKVYGSIAPNNESQWIRQSK